MGMAASQARYLSLVARKTNTEYEGQQINQERTVLANRTADLFNQMLSMSVPTCPDSNDYTTLQYSWSDGYNDSVLSDYYQLGTADEDYNYVVTTYHYEDVYTGQRKLLNDPKIQADRTLEYTYDPTVKENHRELEVKACQYDIVNDIYIITNTTNDIKTTLTRVEDSGDTRLELDAIYDRTTIANAHDFLYDETNGNYVYLSGQVDENGLDILVAYAPVDIDNPEQLTLLKDTFKDDYDETKTYYYDEVYGTYVIGDEIEALQKNMGKAAELTIRNQDDGAVYYTDGEKFITAEELGNITKENNDIVLKSAIETMTFANYAAVGNCDLKLLTDKDLLNKDIRTELDQIIKDMNGENGNKISAANFAECFDDSGNYIGGIYSFKMNGQTYFTTQADLELSAYSAYDDKAYAENGIDSQLEKLPFYKAVYLNTKIEETSKALLETDGKGRFTSVRFEDDSTVYTLNTETITDEDAYRNAMNQYYYKQEKYDKAIRDINAQTELIQNQDRTLELRLKQLDTEQNALQTEMEAVKKVVSKNVESSFKTFGGG